jgi:hemoglobin
MKKDIEARDDIELLVNTFYDKVKKDNVIGIIFNTIIGDDWSHHLPTMYRFWNTILLNQPGYTGNAVKKHTDVDKQMPLQKEHFERWLKLWTETIDSLFEGERAAEAKNRANLMAYLIEMKVTSARLGNNIM